MDEVRHLLEAGDVAGLQRVWSIFAPGMPQPKSRDEAEKTMHLARTISSSVAFKHRAYSHHWLRERGIASMLPDRLRPQAERMYPVVAEAVGVSINFSSPLLAPAAVEVRGAVNTAILDCFANGDRDPVTVSRQMAEAKDRTMRKLFGRLMSGSAVQ